MGEWLDASQPKKAESGPIFKLFWRRIILDEGHTIKNHKTNVSIAVCALDAGLIFKFYYKVENNMD